jgi:hypothetical protein
MTYLKAFAVWLLLMLAETLHGTVRIFLSGPLLGDFRARQLSVFTGATLIFIITAILIKWIRPATAGHSLFIGAFWVILTVCFEVGLGLLVFNLTPARITEDYNLLRGGLMPIGLLLMYFTPLLAAKWRRVF